MREKIEPPLATDAEVEALVAAFERCDLPYPHWTHRAHLAVAVCYLTRFPFAETVARARYHIDLYNRTRGDPTGYHETVTVLFLRRAARFLRDHPECSTPRAVDALAAFDMAWPLRYYSPERLWSAEAKVGWVDPDREPLDF